MSQGDVSEERFLLALLSSLLVNLRDLLKLSCDKLDDLRGHTSSAGHLRDAIKQVSLFSTKYGIPMMPGEAPVPNPAARNPACPFALMILDQLHPPGNGLDNAKICEI